MAPSSPSILGCTSSRSPGLLWVYHFARECVGDQHGKPQGSAPPRLHAGSWAEVTHVFAYDTRERSGLWTYRARGSGVWLWLGATLTFSDLPDLAVHLGWEWHEHNESWHDLRGRAAPRGRWDLFQALWPEARKRWPSVETFVNSACTIAAPAPAPVARR